MAEKGAYLTGTIKSRPSIFEIVAQESLSSTLEPAFKKILSYLVLLNPRSYGWLDRWSDEAYLLFNSALQYHYLKKYSASFSETFYGLKRASLSNGNGLNKEQYTISVISLVVFPYVRNKLYKLAESYKLEESDGTTSKNKFETMFKKFLITFNKIFHTVYEFLSLYRYLLYMSGRSNNPTPFLWLGSLTLTYAEAEKFLTLTELVKKLRLGKLNIGDGVDLFGRLFIRSLEFGAFFLQFLQWWNQENHFTNLLALPTPPPPEIPKIAAQYKGICPICRRPRRIDTALPISGYVFCYQCVLGYINEYGKCPITNYPAKEDDLVRLYK